MTPLKPKPLAVVIPVKDNFEGLQKTLEALWKEAFISERVEIAVVDAGSCLTTSQWLLTQDHRIEHIRSAKDNGVYDAMNYGKNTVNASWIWFLGAGDIPEEGSLISLLDGLITWDPQQLQIHGVAIESPELGVPAHYRARWDSSMIWRNTTHHQGVIYPAELLKEHSFNVEHPILADYGLHLSLFQKAVKAQLHPLTICKVEAGGVSRRFDTNLYREEWKVKKSVLQGLQKWVHPIWLLLKYVFKKSGWPVRV